MLCIIGPNRRTASPEFFSCVPTQLLLSRPAYLTVSCTKETISKYCLPENSNMETYIRVFKRRVNITKKRHLVIGQKQNFLGANWNRLAADSF